MYNYLVKKNLNDLFPYKGKASLKTNIKEVNNEYVFEVELPGYKKEDIKLAIEDGNFMITAKKEQEVKDEKLLRVEHYYGEVTRSFYVGNVLKDKINAKYNNGILTVTIPKDIEAENKKYIEIN